MRLLKLLVTFTFFTLSLGGAVFASVDKADSIQSFTLEQCLNYAFQNEGSIKNAQYDVQDAKYVVNETRGIGFPQVAGEVSYTNDFAIRTMFLPAVFFAEDPNSVPSDAPPVPVRFGIAQSASAGVTINQLVFDGSYIVGLQAANAYQDLSRKDLTRTKINTAEAVTKAFYTALINKESLELVKQNYQQLDTLLRETQIMYDNGFAEQIDVDRIKIRFNNIKAERTARERLVAVSYYLLKFQMGMDINQPLEIQGSLDDLNFSDYRFTETVDTFRYEQRIDHSLLKTQREIAVLNLRNQRVASYPKLNGFLSLGYNAGTDSFGELTDFSQNWFEYGNWGLTLSVPIFSGLQRHYRTQQAKIGLLKAENNLNLSENRITLEIAESRSALQNSLEELAAQEENMRLARGIYDVTKIKYQEGVGSNLEVVEAETAYKEAETNYYNALYNAMISKINLEKALGILLK